MIQGEMFYGTEIRCAAYILTEKTKDNPPTDGWIWYDKPPIAEVNLPCGCCVIVLIDPKTETKESAQATADVLASKVINVKSRAESASMTAEEAEANG
jgi:hypothetical protein